MPLPHQRLDLKLWMYLAICCGALAYLVVANARGYVPFASPQGRYSGFTANHFHK